MGSALCNRIGNRRESRSLTPVPILPFPFYAYVHLRIKALNYRDPNHRFAKSAVSECLTAALLDIPGLAVVVVFPWPPVSHAGHAIHDRIFAG